MSDNKVILRAIDKEIEVLERAEMIVKDGVKGLIIDMREGI